VARKIALLFCADAIPTEDEAAAMDRLVGLGYRVHVRNAAVEATYGGNREPCDVVAGGDSIPEAYAEIANADPVVRTVAFNVFPLSATLGSGGSLQLRAVSAEHDEATDSYTLADRAEDPDITFESADPEKCTVSATGLVTRVSAGGPTLVTATFAGKTSTCAVTTT
jgi:hypothetical protein